MDIVQIGKLIKSKYSQYSGYSDEEVGQKYLLKYRGGAGGNNQPTKTTSPTPIGAERNQYFALIKKYFPESEWNNAYRVMMMESGGNPTIPSQFNKYGTENSYGLFQINLQAHPQMRNKVLNPEENVKYAAQLWKNQGWRPWLNTSRKLGLLK